MVTNSHRRLSDTLKYAFDDQNSFLSRGFQKMLFVQQPPKCIANHDEDTIDDTSSFSSDEQLSPSVSLTPSTSSYSIPSSWCGGSTTDDDLHHEQDPDTTALIFSMGLVFLFLHFQLQCVILLQKPSTNKTSLLNEQQQHLNVSKIDKFDSKSFLPSRYGSDMPPVNDLVNNQVSIETSALWHKYAQLPDRPSTRRQKQQCHMEEQKDERTTLHERQAVQSLVQDVLAYLEEFSGQVVPELEALRPQLQNFIEL